MFEYSVGNDLKLSLKKQPILKDVYKKSVDDSSRYGNEVSKPDITVVVVAYNEGDELIRALSNIYDQQTSKSFEVVLVDNGLDKKTKNNLKKFNLLHVLMKDNIGCSAGRNVGSLFAKAPVLAFVDADGFVNESFIQESLRAHKDYRIAVRGKVLPKTQGSPTPPSYDLGEDSFSYYINAEGISIWDKKAFMEAGGFEDVLYGGEGIVLQNRMIEIYGLSTEDFGYDPRIVLYHDYNSDRNHFKEKQTRYETITRKIHIRYPFLAGMISTYNQRVANLIPKQTSQQRQVSSKIENIRLGVGTKFGEFYRQQHQERIINPTLVNGLVDKPMFSVVIPCYNVGARIKEAVDSVRKQTIRSLEIIIVDDVSTDKKTIQSLVELESQVKIIHHKENRGVAAARNTGVKAAKASYILCLDGDDTIEMDYLEEAFNVFEAEDNVGLVSCWVQLVGARSGEWRPTDKISIPEALLASPVPTATCFRKQAWQKIGGYDENMRGYEDWNFWIGVMKTDLITRVLPRRHFNYTISPTSKVHTSNKNALDLVGKIFDNHNELYKKHLRYVITNKFKDYAVLRSEYVDLKALHGDGNTFLNLFRLSRYPDYAKRAYRKGKSFSRIAWESKDPVYVTKLAGNKLKTYSKTALRKLGLN